MQKDAAHDPQTTNISQVHKHPSQLALVASDLKHVAPQLTTPDVRLAAVPQDGDALYYVPPELMNPEICLAAVTQNGRALVHVPPEVRTPEICLAAVKQNCWALEHVPPALKSPEVCLAAVTQNGRALVHVPPELRTRETCLTAVAQNGHALELVLPELMTPEICLVAVTQDGPRLVQSIVPSYGLEVGAHETASVATSADSTTMSSASSEHTSAIPNCRMSGSVMHDDLRLRDAKLDAVDEATTLNALSVPGPTVRTCVSNHTSHVLPSNVSRPLATIPPQRPTSEGDLAAFIRKIFWKLTCFERVEFTRLDGTRACHLRVNPTDAYVVRAAAHAYGLGPDAVEIEETQAVPQSGPDDEEIESARGNDAAQLGLVVREARRLLDNATLEFYPLDAGRVQACVVVEKDADAARSIVSAICSRVGASESLLPVIHERYQPDVLPQLHGSTVVSTKRQTVGIMHSRKLPSSYARAKQYKADSDESDAECDLFNATSAESTGRGMPLSSSLGAYVLRNEQVFAVTAGNGLANSVTSSTIFNVNSDGDGRTMTLVGREDPNNDSILATPFQMEYSVTTISHGIPLNDFDRDTFLACADVAVLRILTKEEDDAVRKLHDVVGTNGVSDISVRGVPLLKHPPPSIYLGQVEYRSVNDDRSEHSRKLRVVGFAETFLEVRGKRILHLRYLARTVREDGTVDPTVKAGGGDSGAAVFSRGGERLLHSFIWGHSINYSGRGPGRGLTLLTPAHLARAQVSMILGHQCDTFYEASLLRNCDS